MHRYFPVAITHLKVLYMGPALVAQGVGLPPHKTTRLMKGQQNTKFPTTALWNDVRKQHQSILSGDVMKYRAMSEEDRICNLWEDAEQGPYS